MIAAVLSQVLGFIFLWVIYKNIPDINGWTFWEIVFMYAMIYITEGANTAFFEGMWVLGRLINMGEFDRILLRPVSPLVQVVGRSVGMNGYGNLITGSILLAQALIHIQIEWTIPKIIFGIIFFFSAIAIRCSIILIANSTSFWLQASSNSVPFMVHSFCDFAKYPITIFPMAIKVVICVAIPFAFVSFFPATVLFDKSSMYMGLLIPVVAVIFMIIAKYTFYLGVKKYDSTGN
jgi:ABC-2 type transport system permease protein